MGDRAREGEGAQCVAAGSHRIESYACNNNTNTDDTIRNTRRVLTRRLSARSVVVATAIAVRDAA